MPLKRLCHELHYGRWLRFLALSLVSPVRNPTWDVLIWHSTWALLSFASAPLNQWQLGATRWLETPRKSRREVNQLAPSRNAEALIPHACKKPGRL